MKNRKLEVLVIIIAIIIIIGILAKVVLPKIMFPEYEPLPVSGTHQVEVALYTWEDENRIETFTDTGEKRALTVKFWYPKEEGNYPLVIFSHGAFGVIDSNYSTCAELASNGYVVASIGHPYHAMFVEDVNGKTTMVDMEFMKSVYAEGSAEYSIEAERRMYDLGVEWMELRSDDMNFVLNTILEQANEKQEEPFSSIDTKKIGLMGHSMGGATAVELGRTREDIDAVIDLEGTMLGEYVDFQNGYPVYEKAAYPTALLDVNSRAQKEDVDAMEAAEAGWTYVNHYVGANALDYREIIFEDAGHLNFTDLPMFSPVLAKFLGVGKVDPVTCINHVNDMVLIFFDYYLKGKGSLNSLQEVY